MSKCNKSVYLANKSIDMIDAVNKGYIEGYNKAIDDFVKFANTMPTVEEEDGEIRPMWLEEMAEQLKAGVENDRSIRLIRKYCRPCRMGKADKGKDY